MQQLFRRNRIPPRRIRPRRAVALASVTALTLAVSTSAGTGHLMAKDSTTTAAGATAVVRGSALGPA